jgi:tetratricopeptide (TPR) repeat protein
MDVNCGKSPVSMDIVDKPLWREVVLEKRGPGETDLETLKIMEQLVEDYCLRFRWEKAVNLQNEVIEIKTRIHRDGSIETSKANEKLAKIYLAIRRCKAGTDLLETVVEYRKQFLQKGHEDTITAMKLLVNGYRMQGEWEKAIGVQEAVVECNKPSMKATDMGHRDSRRTREEVVLNLEKNALTPEKGTSPEEWLTRIRSEQKHDENLRGKEAAVRMETSGFQAQRMMEELVESYESKGRHDKGIALLIQLAKIKKKEAGLGPHHADTLKVTQKLADFYVVQCRNEEARGIYEAVLDGQKRNFGKEHQVVLDVMYSLSNVYLKLAKYREAEELKNERIECLSRKSSGKDKFETSLAMEDLGMMYWRDLCKKREAIELQKRAVEIMKEVLISDATNKSSGIFQSQKDYLRYYQENI